MSAREHLSAAPFKGPAPLEACDRIYGRDSDLQGLTDILLSDRIVLLYSPSGAGKTSLIEAGYDYVETTDGSLSMDELKGIGLKGRMKAQGFKILPSIRVSEKLPPEIAKSPHANRYVCSVMHSLEKACSPATTRLDIEELASVDLNTYLQQRSFLHNENKPVLLVFDQFEEVLTSVSTDTEHKRRFFVQLGEGLKDDHFWVLFAMREGYIANLDNYLEWIPTCLASRFRLDLMTPDGACRTLTELTRGTHVSIDEDARKYLVCDLINHDRSGGTGKIRDMHEVNRKLESLKYEPLIEPLHLQVVGRDIWTTIPPSQDRVTVDFIRSSGGIDQALISYYDKQLQNVCDSRAAGATRQQDAGLERRVRSWFGDVLITKDNTRALVDADGREVNALRNAVEDRDILRELGEAYLIREELRPRRGWYELAHDRLIQPILRSNKAWLEVHSEPVQRRARQWVEEDKPDELLFSGKKLTDARVWLEKQPKGEAKQERRFVARSVQRRNIRWAFNILSIVLAVVTILLVLVGFWWKSTVEELEATVQRNRVMFLAAAAQIQRWVHHEPEIASLLARQAYLYQTKLEYPSQTRDWVDNALRNAVFAKPFSHSFTIRQIDDRNDDASASKLPLRYAIRSKEHHMAIADHNGSTTIIDLRAERPLRALGDDIATRDMVFNPVSGDLALLAKDHLFLVDKQGNVEKQVLPGVDRLLAFDNDGSKLLTSGAEGLRVWDSQTWSSILLEGGGMDPGEVRSSAFSPDGTRLAVGTSRGRVAVWEVSNSTQPLWKRDSVIDSCEGCPIKPGLVAIGLGPQADHLITVGSVDTDMRVWDLTDADTDSKRLTMDEASKVRDQWTASMGLSIKPTKGTVRILAVAFDPALSKMATGDSNGVVREWMLDPLWHFGESALSSKKLDGRLGPIDYLGFSSTSPLSTLLIATDSIGMIRIFELMDGGWSRSKDHVADAQQSMETKIDQARYIEKEWYYYTMDHADAFHRRAVATGSLSSAEPVTMSEKIEGVDSFDISKHGSLFAIAVGRKVMIADLDKQQLRQPHEVGTHHTAVSTVRFTGEDFSILSGDQAGIVKYWQLKTPIAQGERVWEADADDGENDPVTALAAYSGREWVAAGFKTGRIDLLSLRDGHPVSGVAISPHAGSVTDLSFAPNGDFLASSSSDGTVQLWRTKDWEHLPLLQDHAGAVHDIDFDDEGKQLVSGGDDGLIRLWTLTKNAAPTVLRIRKVHGEIVAVEFTSSGEEVTFIDVRGQTGSLDIVTEPIADQVCDKVWRNLSKEEWERFIPDTDYECTCPKLGPGPGTDRCL